MPVPGSAGVPAGINPAQGRRFQGAGEDAGAPRGISGNDEGASHLVIAPDKDAGAPRGISGNDEGASHLVIAPDKIGFKDNHGGIAKAPVARVERNSVSVLHRMQKGGTWIALRKLRSIQATLATLATLAVSLHAR